VGLQRRRWTLSVYGHEAGEHAPRARRSHREFHITPEEFDRSPPSWDARSINFEVPPREKDEVLAAFAAHKGEVTEGSMAST